MARTTLPDPISRFVDAVNRGDTKSFLAFFPQDGVLDDSGRRFVGHDAIHGWSDREFIGANGKMTVKAVAQKTNGVRVTADWISNVYTGRALFMFVLDGNHIRELRITGE
ncbi:nuclear transport factor 2 family protein [Undibacterium arcticum]|uniref:Nuclear transport factor 2 family protein n=1 Tax=Undibacterium arcticum TaxID=1762892 RepID=A0ABV7F473_9BURK